MTDVAGLLVGHAVDPVVPRGVTVVLAPAGAVGAVDVRGAAPGTRETDLLDPVRLVDRVHGVLLAGGSAFGLAAADGVVAWLAARGHGFPTAHGPVPIVPGAVLYDLGVGDPSRLPTAAWGAAAADAATDGEVACGNVGAGAGATTGKLPGGTPLKGGLGSASLVLPSGLTVAALVVVNAAGDVADPDTRRLFAEGASWTSRGGLDLPAAAETPAFGGRPPGAPATGTAPPSAAPPVATRRIAAPPGTAPSGAAPPGAAPSIATPPTAAPSGATPPVARPPGIQPSIVQPGGQPSVAAPPGVRPSSPSPADAALCGHPPADAAPCGPPAAGTASAAACGSTLLMAVPTPATTLGVIATDAPLTKAQATHVARMAHDGLARAIRPAHTMFDGDAFFVLATGSAAVPPDLSPACLVTAVGAAAADAVCRAIARAIRAADPLPGWPAYRDWCR